VRERLPLQKSSSSRATAPENSLMAYNYSSLGTPKGRYGEHSSKSSLSCETKVYQTSRRKPNFRRWCLLALWHSQATAPENSLMACKYSSLGTLRGRYDEHSSKSSLSCETKVYRTSRRKPNFRRWCLLASWHSRQWRQKYCWCVFT
jgi:hypothetical protein